MDRVFIGGPEHHERRIPKAVERVLGHPLLLGPAVLVLGDEAANLAQPEQALRQAVVTIVFELRDGEAMRSVLPHTADRFGRAVVMPNLKPPVRQLADALAEDLRLALQRGAPGSENRHLALDQLG